MAIFKRQAANCHVMPESLLSAKHDEADPCGLTTKYIQNTCQKKPGWVAKKITNQYKEKSFESLLSHQGEKPVGAPHGGIKHQNNTRTSLGTIFHNFLKLCDPSVYHFNFDQSTYIESCKAKH